MQRLTKKTNPRGMVLLPIVPPLPFVMGEEICKDHRDKVRRYQEYAIRLAAYEDTSLTPADIASLQAECKRLRDENAALEKAANGYCEAMNEAQDELTTLRGQIESGEAVRVPKPQEKRRRIDGERCLNCTKRTRYGFPCDKYGSHNPSDPEWCEYYEREQARAALQP